MDNDELTIAGKSFRSRLMVGTGKYESPEACVAALDASGTEIVTVAIRRLDLDNPGARASFAVKTASSAVLLPAVFGKIV